MKKIIALAIVLIISFGVCINISAAEVDEGEQYILSQLKEDRFADDVKSEYVNQLENYFERDDVTIEKEEAKLFVEYLEDTIAMKHNILEGGQTFFKQKELIKSFEKACVKLNLVVVYNTKVNIFCITDKAGNTIIDSQPIIKDTGDSKDSDKESWNISIEIIFAVVIGVCLLGVLINLSKWYRKLMKKNKAEYDDSEEDDELEVANRRTRKARRETFSYINLKHVLKYCYVPAIIFLIICSVLFGIYSSNNDFKESVFNLFIKTVAIPDTLGIQKYELQTKNENENFISAEMVSWPTNGFIYGELMCKELDIDTPVFFGDGGNLLTKGAGTYIGSSIPGNGKTILIGAHNTTFFKGLKDAEKGNQFTFITTYGIYKYEVTDIKNFDKKDTDSAYDLKADVEELVLYTCYPFGNWNGEKSERMFVYLKLISGPTIKR